MTTQKMTKTGLHGDQSVWEQVLYRWMVAVFFVLTAAALIVRKLAGRGQGEGIWTEARQAAYAAAGYAFRY